HPLPGLSPAAAAAALEEGAEPFVEPAQSVLGATSGAPSDAAIPEEVDRDSLQPSVFVDIGSDRAADQDLLSNVLATPVPPADEAEPAASTEPPAKGRLSSASLARELGQIAAAGTPAATEGA